MSGSFGGGFLGGLLGALVAPLVKALGRASIGALFIIGMLCIVWWQRMDEWQQLLLVCVVMFVLLRWGSRPRYRRRPAHTPQRYPNARTAHELEHEPHWLYRWYDAQENLLYVGISNDPERRMREHLDDPRKPWTREPGVQFEVEPEPYPTRTAVLAAEERAIWREAPIWNVVHNRDGAKW